MALADLAQQIVTLATDASGIRSFPITGLMTIEERGSDKLTITRHPVELGASITDHAYMEPAELRLKMMATSANLIGGLITTGGLLGDAYIINIYTNLLAFQKQRAPFTIQTGKRLYPNMLISSVELSTDEKTEHALMLQIDCQEVIIVQTSTVPVPPAGVQANPAQTAGVITSGVKQPIATTIVPSQITLQPSLPTFP
jgi:hypothetical protein